MSTSQVTTELVYKARDLASGAIEGLTSSIDGMASKAAAGASRITGAFRSMGGALSNAIGNSVEGLASGGSIDAALASAGIYMAGQMAEQFAGRMLENIASSGLMAALAAPLGALGSAMGGLLAAAIPIGMALLPVLIVGAIVAAVVFLINNPDIVQKIIDFASGLVSTLVDAVSGFLSNLPTIMGDLFAAAWDFIINGVVPFIGKLVELWMSIPQRLLGLGASILGTIIDGLAGLPGKLMDIVGDAFRSLRLDIGPFHISASGVTVDLPNIDVPHFASGVRNFGGGLAIVGEVGPELVRLPRGSDVYNHRQLAAAGGGGGGPATIVLQLDGRTVAKVTDRNLYYMRQNAPT